MDKLQVDRVPMNTPSSSSATTPSSRPTSRRTSTIIPRESLPTPPPDPRESLTRDTQIENVFVYPPTKKDLPIEFHGLLNYAERQEDFQRMLNRSIAIDCQNFHQTANAMLNERKSSREEDKRQQQQQQHQCQCCDRIRKECEESIEPLHYRLTSTIAAALAAYGAVEQLNRMYSMWDQYVALDRKMCQRKECLRYVKSLERKLENARPLEKHQAAATFSDQEIDHQDMEQSLALLETILKPEQTGQHHNQPKQLDVKQ